MELQIASDQLDRSAGVLPNGLFTLESPTGAHRTFRVRTKKIGNEPRRVIEILAGPENTSDYSGFGFVEADRIRVWKRYRSGNGVPTDYEKMAKVIPAIYFHPENFERARLLVAEACIRCGRALTDPESIRAKIGPVCAAK